MEKILLSVIMTNFNHSSFLYDRIPSILEQLPDHGELVIVDDASTDLSVSIVESFASKDSRIRLIRNKRNLGVVDSVNIALQAAKGTYIASLAADDRILPGFIQKTLQVLKDHPEISICCSDCGLSFDGFEGKDPNAVETTILYKSDLPYHVFPPHILPKIFRNSNFWIPGHSSIIKREAMLRHGGFDKRLEFLCDWFLIHSIALNEGVAYIPQTLSVWRQHNKTYSASLKEDEQKKRHIYRQLIAVLSEEKHKITRKNFRKSTILHFYQRELFFELIRQPKDWDFVFCVILKVLRNRAHRYFKRLFRIP